jgi:ATP-dependent protease ClpP protease subunit
VGGIESYRSHKPAEPGAIPGPATKQKRKNISMNVKMIITGTAAAVLGIVILFALASGVRYYKVWSQEMIGKAKLAEAGQTRQIQIEQARGELEASKLRAEAIQIMGEAAQRYPEYRQQEFMAAFGEALREGNIQQIVYIPTEANIPIMEANRINK